MKLSNICNRQKHFHIIFSISLLCVVFYPFILALSLCTIALLAWLSWDLNEMKWEWNNCPMAWHMQLKSSKKNYSIGLVGVVDSCLQFWYAIFGFAE